MARVGLLEDNSKIAKLCATMLHYVGHEVIIYEHPSQCLDALHIADPSLLMGSGRLSWDTMLPVEVLILDLHLPDIGGLEVLRRLKATPHTRKLPLIFCTAAPDHELEQAFRIAPQAGLVEKPFTLQVLLTAIRNALQATS